MASELGATIALVHAFDDAPGAHGLQDPTFSITADLEACGGRSAAARCGVPIEPFVRRGAPWDKLVNLATDLGADLIVVGSQGTRGDVQERFLGTVASRLAAISTRAVLVVPSKQPAAAA